MTFAREVDGSRLHLICNECGRHHGVIDRLAEVEPLWRLLEACGWAGTPMVQGPHACPRCVKAPGRRGQQATGSGPAAACTAQLRTLPEAALVVLCGALLRGTVTAVRDALAQAVATGSNVIVDLAAVEAIDSDGRALLVRACQDARSHRRTLCFAAPTRFVRAVLHTADPDRPLVTFDSLRLAQTWLAAVWIPTAPPSVAR